MTKSEIEKERLGNNVIMPCGCDEAFLSWWKRLPNDAVVSVQYPHNRHGNSGKVSNNAESDAKSDFLEFIDINSQPNGRSADSSSATHYLLPKFRTIQTPKKGVSKFETRMQQSQVGVFNKYQGEKNYILCD